MKERLKAIAPKVGFPLFYLFCLVIFARWTFPYEKLRDRIVMAFNQQQRDTGGQQELKIEEIGPSWLSGISAKGIRLIGAPSEPGKPPSEIKVDEASGSISLFGLMFGDHDLSLRVSAFGGTIKGSFDDSPKERKIDVTVEGVDLGQIPMFTDALGVPVEGTLDGTVKLSLPDQKASKATGAVSLDMSNVAVGDGKAKLQGLLALPRLLVGSFALAGDAKDGVLKISKIAAGGKDVELQGEGRIQIREQLVDSMTDMNLRIKINDAYRGKNDTTKSLFGAPGSNVPGVFDLSPKVKQSKRADGFYGWHMRGTLARPDFDPAPFSGPSGPGAGPGTTGGMPGAAPMMPNPGGGSLR
jgi:type II secretion system protein N